MTANRVAIVGDIHGMIGHLRNAVAWLRATWDSDVIFVGDYINRGPNSYQVLDELISLRVDFGPRLKLLLGNHEVALLEFLEEGNERQFVLHGGLATVLSYLRSQRIPIGDYPLSQFREHFPPDHLALLRSMTPFYEQKELLVTHSGYNPRNPESRELTDITLGRSSSIFDPNLDSPRQLVVFGHFAQRSGVPYISKNLICIDTGCGVLPASPLSVLTLPDRDVLTFGG